MVTGGDLWEAGGWVVVGKPKATKVTKRPHMHETLPQSTHILSSGGRRRSIETYKL